MDIDNEILRILTETIELGNRARTLRRLLESRLKQTGGGALVDVPTVAELQMRQNSVYWGGVHRGQNTGTTGIRDGAPGGPGAGQGHPGTGEEA